MVTGINKTRYVDGVNGDDSWDGTTATFQSGTTGPCKTFDGVWAKMGSVTGFKISLYITAGTYSIATLRALNVDFNIICSSGRAIIAANAKSGSDFSQHSGSTYVVASYSASAVYDFSNRDATTNAPQKLSVAANLDACIATAGTWVIDSGNTYVHTFDDRAPDSNLVASFNSTLTAAISPKANTYMKNITIVGTPGPLYLDVEYVPGTRNNYVFDSCEFIGSTSTGCLRMRNDYAFVFLENSVAYHGTGTGVDGFNYHDKTTNVNACFLEVNCKGCNNGSGPSDNGSTCHDGISGIRINGMYNNNGGRDVHDIGTGGSWNINCSTSGGPIGWRCGDGGTTKMWLLDCSSSNHATNDAEVASGTEYMYIKNTDTSGWSISGTLTPYE